MLVSFLISLGFFIVQSASAQSAGNDELIPKPLKQYDIEIILFKNIKVPKGNEKILPIQAPQLDENYISFANEGAITAASELGFVIPEENEYRLVESLNKIKKSSRYKLLSHMVWRQPGLAKDKAISVQIRTGKLFGNDFSSIDAPVKPLLLDENLELQLTQLKDVKPLSTEQDLSKPELVWYEVEGKITITLARYLHAYVDLVIRIPNENAIIINKPTEINNSKSNFDELSFTSATLNNFSFKEHRRMRSRKLHYLDHPEIGMLILMTPYEEPQEIEFIEDTNI